MGASHGCCIQRQQRPPIYKRQLSAAFNMSAALDDAPPLPKLNLNTATPEQLMTLPGIDRSTANKIVAHRHEIGGFRRVEDVALVTGAARLTEIRGEVCVRRLGATVGDDVSRSSTTSSRSRSSALDVNTADVFQLTRVPGVTQSLAERIVSRRDRRGPFRHLDELTRVRGVRPTVLATARPYLTIVHTPSPATKQNGCIPNGIPKTTSLTPKPQHHITGKSDLYPLDGASLLQMYGPLIRRSIRRVRPTVSLSEGRVRVAVWNLEQLGREKATNPGVREVVCMTLLENSVSILAVQDLLDSEALQILCDELNSPTIPNVQRFAGARGHWQCVSSSAAEEAPAKISSTSHLGFIYDTSVDIELVRAFELDDFLPPGGTRGCKPFCAVFKVQNWQTSLVNCAERGEADCVSNGMRVKAAGSNGISVDVNEHHMLSVYHNKVKDLDNVIVMGELDADEACLSRLGYTSIYSDGASTCDETNDTIKYVETSRIWVGPSMQPSLTGECCAIRKGLTSPWIPSGWSWGGPASHHRPLWAEFYTKSSGTVV